MTPPRLAFRQLGGGAGGGGKAQRLRQSRCSRTTLPSNRSRRACSSAGWQSTAEPRLASKRRGGGAGAGGRQIANWHAWWGCWRRWRRCRFRRGSAATLRDTVWQSSSRQRSRGWRTAARSTSSTPGVRTCRGASSSHARKAPGWRPLHRALGAACRPQCRRRGRQLPPRAYKLRGVGGARAGRCVPHFKKAWRSWNAPPF